MKLIVEATKEMIYAAQKSEEWCIVDTRSSDTYIGWKRAGEIGGHLPYAKFFSAEWLKKEWRDGSAGYEAQLELQLKSQMITPEKNIIVYDENGEDADIVCDYLLEKGITRLFYYQLKNWEGDISKYPNYRLMAPVWWIKDVLDGKRGDGYPEDDFKIFEISWKEPSKEYLETHIPGAVHIDSNEFECSPMWIMVNDEVLKEFARKNGVAPDTSVVIYGNTPLNFGASAKLATVFRYLGIKEVMCMNGILKNWISAGYPTEKGCVKKKSCEKKTEYMLEKKHALHMNEIKKILANKKKGAVIDTRVWSNYIGATSGYPYLDKAGRIPGTVWSYYPREYMTPNNQIGNVDVMFNVWETAGIDTKKTMAFFCGSASWGASLIKTFANVAGYENATIYEGGWCEWCNYPENPYETGIPEELRDYDPEQFQVDKFMSKESCHIL